MLKGSVPVWIGILFCLAAIAFPLSRIPRIEWMAHIADPAMLIPSAAMAWQMLRK
jgi:hypothetical protein